MYKLETMKYILLSLMFVASMAYAQTDSQSYKKKYDKLVSQVGITGVGVETLLNHWEADDSLNADMLLGRFRYYFVKSQSTEVVKKAENKYLGMEPILKLKDSLDRDVYYYQELMFEDEVFGRSIKVLDKLIGLYPDNLDYKLLKGDAYLSYEKGNPDMAVDYLIALSNETVSRSRDWKFGDKTLGKNDFSELMQDYCYTMFLVGTPASKEAFFNLSETLHELFPDDVNFPNNIGSYYMLMAENKTALKWFSKVLKKDKGNMTAIQNSILACRLIKNIKLEKKYLEMMVEYGPEMEVLKAQARLKALNAK